MTLSAEQADAVDICAGRVMDGEPLTKLFGFAGTGKTTVIRSIADRVGGDVIFCAPTGKAASVMSRKGCPASTIHRLCYRYTGEVVKRCRSCAKLERPVRDCRSCERSQGHSFDPDKFFTNHPRAAAIIIDEASMAGRTLALEVLSLGIPVIAVGDDAQLPPVGDRGYFTKGTPDARLSTVMRHDGPILDLATDIRLNGVSAVKRSPMCVRSIGENRALSFDQILCGKNLVRQRKISKIRSLRGYPSGIEAGDRVICLENNYQLNVFNGQQFRVLQVSQTRTPEVINLKIACECDAGDTCVLCGWAPHWVPTYTAGFSDSENPRAGDAMKATFGNVITVHKAQGSEWGSVLVINDGWGWTSADRTAWLYTAVTRARERLVIIHP